MAKWEFLQNLRLARSLFFAKVKTDHGASDPRKLESQIARAAIWLTPSSVKGFDLKDFTELSQTQRDRLQQGVLAFLEIATHVPADKSPTDQQLRKAMTALRTVFEVLEPYFPDSPEVELVERVLGTVQLPNQVRNRHFELYSDSTGDPAVRLWFFVDDATAQRKDFSELTETIRKRVQHAFSVAGIPQRPYIYFRTAAEQRAM